jgi:flagellar biosynthesis protein
MNQKDEKPKGRPLQRAVALKYVPKKDRAPKVTAKGSGLLADKIIRLAKEHGIPVHEDPALMEVLSQLDFHEEIPPSVYTVVAEILAFVYSMNNHWSSMKGEKG